MNPQRVRCAVYTRKSTEEGLDQAFNSLDAQRDACEAYIQSQAGEGWILVREHYDDGGFSGGNMERPGLERLLADVVAGHIDVVVVYKIDRLTRSLRDFAKIVDQLEKRNASFVSVTQAFNTTTSMGRLTLNVLLSFAQFEREVTAERIRDKISASRKRGIFMGGSPPLGYDAKDRKLVINPAEAETVKYIFTHYLEVSGIAILRADLEAKGIRTKQWISTRGRQIGGGRWYIGPLRYMLHNRVYIGDAMHKGSSYPGEHEAILPRELFDAVQNKLAKSRASDKRRRTIGSHALLTGLIFDEAGNAMSPKRSYGNNRGQHLYYVSQARLQNRDPNAIRPIPGQAVEDVVRDRLNCVIAAQRLNDGHAGVSAEQTDDDIRAVVRHFVTRIEVGTERVVVTFDANVLVSELAVPINEVVSVLAGVLPREDQLVQSGDRFVLTVPVSLRLRGGLKRIEGWDQSNWTARKPRHDANLIRALARAHDWRQLIETGQATNLEGLADRVGQDRKHLQRLLRLAFLAPDLQRDIMTGNQPPTMSLSTLIDADIPIAWTEQRKLLGTQVAAKLG